MQPKNISPFLTECAEVIEPELPALSALRNEKIFITGGTGFMGTWLLEMIGYLNDRHKFNTQVVVLARNALNLSAKAPHLALRKDIALIEKDVRNLTDIPGDVTYIIHAAANPDNRGHASDPVNVMQTIAQGTHAVLEAAFSLSNVKKILNVSSGLIYGAQPTECERMNETFRGGPDCDSILSVYPEAKRYSETLCTAYRNQGKLPIVTVRPFTVMGPYQLLDKPWAHTNFIRDSFLGGPVRIMGNACTVRSYLYASDMALWLLRILVDGKPGLSYNLGSPEPITLQDMATKTAGFFSNVVQVMCDKGRSCAARPPSRFIPDVSLAMTTLGLTIKVPLDEALRRTIAWHKRHLSPDAG